MACILCALLIAYIIVALLLLRFPELLHRKKRLPFDTHISAHRGGSAEHLENTLAAFQHARGVCKADMLELDLQLTKDGQVVVCHDANLLRCTGHNVNISDVNYKDLPCLRQHLSLAFGSGCCQKECRDDRIPLFSELLQAMPGVPMNLDLKAGGDELIRKTAELLHKYERTEITLWGSGITRVMEKCYKHDPSIPIYFSSRRILSNALFFWTGLLGFMPIREAAYEVPLPSVFLEPPYKSTQWYWVVIWYAVEFLLLNKMLISHLRRRGIPTVVWVCNTEEHYRRACELGVNGIHTDFPSNLHHYYKANGCPPSIKS